MSDYKQKLVKGGTYIGISMIVVRMLSMISSIILARLLGPENLGVLTILRDIGGIVIPLMTCGIPIAMTKFIAEYNVNDQDKLKNTFSTGFTIIFVFALIGSIIYFLAADFVGVSIYHKPILSTLMKINAIYITLSVLVDFVIGVLQGFQRIKQMAMISIINAAVSLPILYLFIISMGLIGVIVAGAIGVLINLLVVLRFLMPVLHEKRLRFHLNVDKKSIVTLLKYSLPLLLSIIILRPARLYGLSYLGIFCSYTEVGYYRVAMSLHNIVLFIPSALSVPLLPLISELQSDIRKRANMISRIIRLQILAILPVVVGLGLTSKYVLFILYGTKYINADVITYIMLSVAVLSSVFSTLGILLQGTGRTQHILLIDIANASMFVMGSAYLIDLFGVNGFGLLWLFTSLILLVPYIFYLIKTSDIDFNLIKVPMLLSILFLSSGFVLIRSLHGVDLIMSAIVMVTSLVGIEIAILMDDDKRILIGAFKSVLSR
mgnify:CR=1 FL=1